MPLLKKKLPATQVGYILAAQAVDQPRHVADSGGQLGPRGADRSLAMAEEVPLVAAAARFAAETARLPHLDRIREGLRTALHKIIADGEPGLVDWLDNRETIYDQAIERGRGSGIPGAIGVAYADVFDTDAPDVITYAARRFAATVRATRHGLKAFRVVDG